MDFGAAFKELRNGKMIRRNRWEKDDCLKFEVVARDGSAGGKDISPIVYKLSIGLSHFTFDLPLIMSGNWVIEDDESHLVSFDTAMKEVAKGAKVRLKDWKWQHLMFDKDSREIVLKHAILREYDFTQDDFFSSEWELCE